MRQAFAVIGANFGDESKGKIVDALVKRHQDIFTRVVVARFNGGGQAGHTVQLNGVRHVFSHVGAGALRGAATYLSSRFITNFFILDKEIKELKTKGYYPEVIISPASPVTTLFDIKINELLESSRSNRHGSCGLGINETVTRSTAMGGKFKITSNDVFFGAAANDDKFKIVAKLRLIFEEWVKPRMYSLGIDNLFRQEMQHLGTEEALIAQAESMITSCKFNCVVTDPLTAGYGANCTIILEGAQGLMLDAELGFFPHVTRSLTGLPYALEAAAELGITEVTPIYCTRSYLTRHGEGPLSHSGEEISADFKLTDLTNIPNEWQGTLRTAPLNLKLLKSFISQDLSRSAHYCHDTGVRISNPQISVSCLDQVGKSVNVYDADLNKRVIESTDLIDFIEAQVSLPVTIKSYGPEEAQVYFSRDE